MTIEEKLAEMGLELVPQSPTIGNFVPSVRVGELLFVAGHLPRQPDGTLLNSGKVGRDVTIEQGYEAARLAMINCLTSVKEAVGDLDKVKRVVKLLVMVNATEDFDRHFLVRPVMVNATEDFDRHDSWSATARPTCWLSYSASKAGTPGPPWGWEACRSTAAWRSR